MTRRPERSTRLAHHEIFGEIVFERLRIRRCRSSALRRTASVQPRAKSMPLSSLATNTPPKNSVFMPMASRRLQKLSPGMAR